MDDDGEWGEGTTAYDYGFRIYNPAIARFLSVDPLSPDYPWYTPYQFAGNKPIRAIDLDGLEEKDVIGDLYKLSVDMRNAPKLFKSTSGRVVKSTPNLHGYAGNNLYYWETIIDRHPELLDDWNKGDVLVEGRSPRVTAELKQRFKNHGLDIDHWKSGEVIDHHHVNQKSQAVPLSRSQHNLIPKLKAKDLVRNTVKAASKGAGVVGLFGDVAGWLNGNPESSFNYFDNSIEVGVVKKEQQSGLFYTVVHVDKEEDSGMALFNIYNTYRWNDELGKYEGENLVGRGYQYEEKGGYNERGIYNLEGELIDIKNEGTPEMQRF